MIRCAAEDQPMSATIRIDVDLFSDTVTRPTPAMRRFMCDAEVGDEQKGEDPTVNHLQEMVAELLGKEAAVFLPSGTMCNEIAMRVHCRHGDEMLAHRTAHPIHFETGGPAALAGVNVRPLDGARGQFDAAAVHEGVRFPGRHSPRSRLLWVEQTSNLGGGSVWPLERVARVVEAGRGHGLAAHLDGARLMNAVVASGVSARAFAEPFDSAWIDFTKGLGAPVGAALAGSRDFLAEGLAGLPGIKLDPAEVDTNLVFFDVTGSIDAPTAVERLLAQGVRMGAMGPRTIRAVTHLDVDSPGIDRAL